MAVLEIKKFGEPVLRKKSQEVEKITPEIKKLVLNMVETMKKNKGIGLAAPQVGVLKRVIVVQPDTRSSRFLGLINPKITRKSRESEIGEEGCLSFPDIYLNIKRAKEIEVEALAFDNKKIKMKFKGFGARVVQHEIDHLDGILFFQRLRIFQKIRFKLKYLSIKL